MITSTAPAIVIARLRHTSGPNPPGSKLTNNERLHVIWLLTVLIGAIEGKRVGETITVQQFQAMLNARGLSDDAVAAVLGAQPADPVALADALAIHPSLQSPNYLD